MKIKSLLSLFLALTILGTRVGYALNIHYCKDKIAKFHWHIVPQTVIWIPILIPKLI